MRGETLKPCMDCRSPLKTWSPALAALYLWFQILRAQHCGYGWHGPRACSKLPGALCLAKRTRPTTGIRTCATISSGHRVAIRGSLIALQGPRAVVRVCRAAGLGPLAHGSDGAGSIRIPRAVWRLWPEPSFGRVPNWPNADIWGARSHNGPSRALGGRCPVAWGHGWARPRDPTSIDSPPEDYLAAVAIRSRRYEACVWPGAWILGYAPVDPEVRRLTAAAAARFPSFGCEVEAVNPGWDDPRGPASIMWYVSYAARFGERYDQHPRVVRAQLRRDD